MKTLNIYAFTVEELWEFEDKIKWAKVKPEEIINIDGIEEGGFVLYYWKEEQID